MSRRITIGDIRCSGSTLDNFCCTWTIPKFSTLDSTFRKGHNSEYSHPMERSELKYYLIAYPGGNIEDKEDHVACKIDICCPPAYDKSGISINFAISLCNLNGDVLHSESQSGWKVLLPKTGICINLVKRCDLLPKLTNDTLVICVEGLYSMSTVTKNNATEYHNGISPYAKMAENYEEFYAQTEKADVRFCTDDGNAGLLVHSTVLCARSKVFAAMFTHDTVEKNSRRVEVEDFDTSTIKSMLKFMYTGRVGELNFKQATELLRAADKYDLDDLKTLCTNFLLSQIDNKNFASILISAVHFNADNLLSGATEYVCLNRSEILVDEYEVLIEHPKVLCRIVKAMKNH